MALRAFIAVHNTHAGTDDGRELGMKAIEDKG
jgi:hypothetical protein